LLSPETGPPNHHEKANTSGRPSSSWLQNGGFLSFDIEWFDSAAMVAASALLVRLARRETTNKMAIIDLDRQLREFRESFARTAPAGRAALYENKIEELRSTFARRAALEEGDRAPDFSLPNAQGRTTSLSAALRQGPAVVVFYRGGWCPYCNLQLRAYQALRPELEALGPSMLAISPQLPDASLSTAEREALTFDVLSDLGNEVARRFGLVYSLPQEVRDALSSNNKALPDINGDDSWELPVPATYVIARNRRISLAFIEVDYRQRLAPQQLLAALREQESA
jgi:peroxiredoxin